jgi:hypothetical protein
MPAGRRCRSSSDGRFIGRLDWLGTGAFESDDRASEPVKQLDHPRPVKDDQLISFRGRGRRCRDVFCPYNRAHDGINVGELHVAGAEVISHSILSQAVVQEANRRWHASLWATAGEFVHGRKELATPEL